MSACAPSWLDGPCTGWAPSLGIRPDLKVDVRVDILQEIDGPTLRHGLQEMVGVQLVVPRARADKPDDSAIAERYGEFLASNR